MAMMASPRGVPTIRHRTDQLFAHRQVMPDLDLPDFAPPSAGSREDAAFAGTDEIVVAGEAEVFDGIDGVMGAMITIPAL